MFFYRFEINLKIAFLYFFNLFKFISVYLKIDLKIKFT